jgi:hypothetical protein
MVCLTVASPTGQVDDQSRGVLIMGVGRSSKVSLRLNMPYHFMPYRWPTPGWPNSCSEFGRLGGKFCPVDG